ncbi:hypothetical protein Ddye_019544, partial [Dipteronia dyeriana]
MEIFSSRLLLFLPCVLHFVTLTFSQPNFLRYYCLSNKGNCTTNTTYSENLKDLISSAFNNSRINYGFYNFYVGGDNSTVNRLKVFASCRGDIQQDVCLSCLNASVSRLTNLCCNFNQDEAISHYENCMLRLSSRSMFQIVRRTPRFALTSPQNITASLSDQFNQALMNLLYSLRSNAASGNTHQKFAIGKMSVMENKIYAFVQCTPDLSKLSCTNCLGTIIGRIQYCCNDKEGSRIYAPSCKLRFDSNSFFDPATVVQEIIVLPPPMPSKNSTILEGNDDNISRSVIIIVVPAAAFMILIMISICIIFRVKNCKEKITNTPCVKDVKEMPNIESLQFNSDTIRAATDNFSEANIIGQGTFGVLDVFSFGVLVLELVSGQRRSFCTEEEIECLLTNAWKRWNEGTTLNVIDSTLREGSRNEMMKCIHIGLLCVQESVSDRPTMASVIHMLNSDSAGTLPAPSKPGFFMQAGSVLILNASSSSSEHNSTGLTESDRRRIATAPFYKRMHNSAMNFRNLFVFLWYMLTISTISCTTNWDRWEHCYDTGNFTANSTYATNRNLLLSSLASNITVLNSGFYNTTIGQEPDRVYGLALCRGDVSSKDCSSCVNSTSQDIMSTCHSTKEALMWAGDPPCLVHYADRSLFGKVEMYVPTNPYYRGNRLTMNLTEFDKIWQPLMERTMREASSGSSENKFATQEANLTSIQKIYALMQCTPDLSQSDCHFCLTRFLDEYKKCCHGRQGGGVESPNFMLRWDLSLFYKDIVLPPLLSPPPVPTTMDEGIGIAVGTGVIIVVSVIIFMLLFSLCCFFLGKLKQKQIRNNQGRKYWKEMTNIESLQFDIGTIRAATENFSEAKKLGQGGFGPVYKGTLPNGQQVAIKRLSLNSKQGEVEFKNEVTLLAKLQHRNLVRLLGFCLERKERILVYEFLPNSSLDHFIF